MKKAVLLMLAVLMTTACLAGCSDKSSPISSSTVQPASTGSTDSNPEKNDLENIQTVLESKKTEFAIVSIENRDTYLDVTVPDYDGVLRIKSCLEIKGLNENLADVHTERIEPSEDLPVSDTVISDPVMIQNLVSKLCDIGYDFGFSSSSRSDDKVEIYVCYEHNVDELKNLLTDCNVDLSATDIKFGGGIRVNGIVETLCTHLESNKDNYNITDIEYVSPPTSSGVEALRIDLADDSKLDDLLTHIKDTAFVSTMQIPISIAGEEYRFYE